MSDNQLLASEVIGELKKLSRTFDALQNAERILSVLVEADNYPKKLEAQMQELGAAIAALEEVKSGLEDEVSKSRELVKKNRQRSDDAITLASEKAAEIVEKANKEATSILGKASNEAAKLRQEVDELADKKRSFEKDVLAEEIKLKTLKEAVEKMKAGLWQI